MIILIMNTLPFLLHVLLVVPCMTQEDPIVWYTSLHKRLGCLGEYSGPMGSPTPARDSDLALNDSRMRLLQHNSKEFKVQSRNLIMDSVIEVRITTL